MDSSSNLYLSFHIFMLDCLEYRTIMPIIFPLATPDIFAPGPSDSHQLTSHTNGDRVTWEIATCQEWEDGLGTDN